jgi:hypothetical protein
MDTLKRMALLCVAAPAIAFAAVACSDDATSENSAQQSDVDSLSAQIQDNEVLFALKAVGDLHLHDLDEGINAGTIEDDYLPRARTVIRYFGLTDWPADLEADAEGVEEAAIQLVQALDDGDAEAAKAPATLLHDRWHDFEGPAWAEIGGDLPPEAGIDDTHDSGGSTTPGAGESPAADTTPAEGDDHSE